jgi:hypothetical protein
MSSGIRITLPGHFTVAQERLIRKYLVEGRQSLTSAEWPILLMGFDALHEAIIEIGQSIKQTFRQVYETQVDIPLADSYIQRLLALKDVAREHSSLRAEIARSIVAHLRQSKWCPKDNPETNLLLAYCLYFWESFATGYAFEVEIFRDLTKSGVSFQAHDIRHRSTRLSPYDLQVLNLRGDIKASSYFLLVRRGRGLPHDFYITRLYEGRRQRTLVVMLQVTAWDEIDGDTIEALLSNTTFHFPSPVSVTLEMGTVVIVDYEVWKAKVVERQES